MVTQHEVTLLAFGATGGAYLVLLSQLTADLVITHRKKTKENPMFGKRASSAKTSDTTTDTQPTAGETGGDDWISECHGDSWAWEPGDLDQKPDQPA